MDPTLLYDCKWLLFSGFVQKLYYIKESHGIVVTDLAFLPDTLKGKSIKGNNETAMLSVAVDSRCQVHTVSNRSKSSLLIVSLLDRIVCTKTLSAHLSSICSVFAPESFPVWFVLFCCGLMVVAVILLLQYVFPGFI